MDYDVYWPCEELCDEFAASGDEEAFLAGLESLMLTVGFTEDGEHGDVDADEFIEILSTAAHNCNVGRPIGELLGFS